MAETTMAGPIRFWFDFASPYAYCAIGGIEDIAAEFGRTVVWRPILMWAVLKAQGIPAPLDAPAKRAYMLHDMRRSAAFHGVAYTGPAKLPISTHLAARLYYAVNETDPVQADTLARSLFAAFLLKGMDISDEATLLGIAGEAGISEGVAREAMTGPAGRTLLQRAVDEAVAAGVIGSPFFLVDGEGFFGADRLPQLRWYLSEGGAA